MAHTILAIKNATVKLANTRVTPTFVDHSDAIDNCKATISSEDFKWVPISGNTQNQTGALQYEVVMNLGQDTKTGGLMNYLLTNHGALGKIEFYPKGGATPKFAADVILKAAADYGGGVGVATTTVTLRVDGAPVITWD